jgi:hypothetical protein
VRRLTDSELQSAIGFCERGQIERPLLALRTSLDDDMSKALLGVLVELKERRAKDLTSQERQDLRTLTILLRKHSHEPYAYDGDECDAAIEVIDKLSAAGRGK